jgi:phosphoribosylformylglycinamidine synthase subunit PurL
VIGMVGLIEDLAHVTRATFQHDGDAILLLGDVGAELGGSEYLATVHGKVLGAPPHCDVEREKKVIDVVLEAIRSGLVSSAHDCSDGGLAIALAECCVANLDCQSGAEIDLSIWKNIANRALLFGETQARIVFSTSAPERVIALAHTAGIPCARIGTVRRHSDALAIKLASASIRAPLARLRHAYHDTIPNIMSRTPEHASFDELAPVAGH